MSAAWSLPDFRQSRSGSVCSARRPSSAPGAAIFPPLHRLRDLSHAVSLTAAHALVAGGAAPHRSDRELEEQVAASAWRQSIRSTAQGALLFWGHRDRMVRHLIPRKGPA